MNILITGGTGFIGTKLCERLLQDKHQLVVLTRKTQSDFFKTTDVRAISSINELTPEDTFDAVINLAGEPIADKRWTHTRKNIILQSRIQTTQALIDFFKTMTIKPKLFISGSAIGFYGMGVSDATITEQDIGDHSFSSQLCQQWEQQAWQADQLGIRTCLIRTGIVLDKNGGALNKMLPPFKLGVGGKIGSGKQWMSWIHREDLVGIILHCIENQTLNAAINGCAPNPVTNNEFTKTLGKVLNRPTIFSMPSFAIKLLMGEMGNELLLNGKKIVSTKLEKHGYQFKYVELDDALQNSI
ncbi:TIGR01777 family oxidoreductase [Marinicellulosiphila megalodicopiae]|uniref:TIGR01777 family oxidoreductase n=1 Tax=Marinicellulosiphila megalodicopiae TaxID=2724896 RepID=UPI003BB1ADCB